MILEFKTTGQTMNHDFDTFTDYLWEEDAHKVNVHLHEWPAKRNVFIDRMAGQLKPGVTGRLALSDFTALVSAATSQRPNCVHDFRVTVDVDGDGTTHVAFTVLHLAMNGMVPLSADNSGFFEYAMRWMGKNRPEFTLSVFGSEFFWVHVE